MNIKREFIEGIDRYTFDFGPCTASNGYAQVDTADDAWYYGCWANPTTRRVIEYAEGDLTTIEFDTPEEFAAYMREFVQTRYNPDRKLPAVDAYRTEQAWIEIGCQDLLH